MQTWSPSLRPRLGSLNASNYYVMTLFGGTARCGELDVTQWLCRVQEPLEGFFKVANGALPSGSQISLRVLDCARQGVDVVVQAVKFVARHD